MKRKILLIILALGVIGAVIGHRLYNERTPTASEKAADMTVDAITLFKAYSTDEVAAGKSYNDKVLQVSGTVRSIDRPEKGPVNVMLETGDPMGAVVCEFAPEGAPDWQQGKPVTLKGICAGYNLDVLLQRCAAVE